MHDGLQQLPGTLSTICSGETVLVNPATGRFYGLSPSASLAWLVLAQPRTPAEVVQSTLSHYSDAPLSAAGDLMNFLAELAREGLVIRAEMSNPEPAAPLAATASAPYTPPRLQCGTLAQAANGFSGADDGQTTGFGTPLLS